jgi:hypothetical protein
MGRVRIILMASLIMMLAIMAWADESLTGKVYFFGYSTLQGKSCSGFMVADNGTYYCLLDNPVLLNLKTQVSGNPVSRVAAKGEVTQNGDVRYLYLDDFTVLSSTPSSLGSIPGQPEIEPATPPTAVPPMSPMGY